MTSVSVIIPAFNAERFVGQAVASALGQTVPVLEVIVCDDGSEDRTGDIVDAIADDRVRRLALARCGVSEARNRGAAAARGDLIALLDADDVWHPAKLERQLELYEAQPDVGLVYCGYAMCTEDLRVTSEILPRELDLRRWVLLEGNGFGISSTGLIPRKVFEAVGGFDGSLGYCEDMDFVGRIASLYPIVASPEALVAYRAHPAQSHRNLESFESHRRRILEARLGDVPKDHARALGNLHARLFFYSLRAKKSRDAVRHLRRALLRPDRLLMLPTEAALRRGRRWWRERRERGGAELRTFGEPPRRAP